MDQIILPVKSDVIFAIYFADERNIEFLTDFLKSALQIPTDDYDEVTIIDPRLIRDFPEDKLGIVDVKLRLKSGRIIHIEIQVAPLPYMAKRITYYDSKMITEQIGKSENYEEIKQVITIIITEKEFITNSSSYHHRFTMYDKTNGVELTDIVEVHTLELCKLSAEPDNSRLDIWMRFIKAEEASELEAIAQKDPLIKKAVARLVELSADEKARLLYEKREKERMDSEVRENYARSEGEKAGQKAKAIQIAKSLLALGVPIDTIIAATGLTSAEVEELRVAK